MDLGRRSFPTPPGWLFARPAVAHECPVAALSCPGRSAATQISLRNLRTLDCVVVRCRHRSRVYPRSALRCAQVGQARLAWTAAVVAVPASRYPTAPVNAFTPASPG